MVKIDHFYIKVTDLDRAIIFDENLLNAKISNREKDRWADFANESKVYFGIYNATIDNDTIKSGDNITLALKTNELDKEHKRIVGLSPKFISEIIVIEQPSLYRYFQFEDEWGNIWEVAEYNY